MNFDELARFSPLKRRIFMTLGLVLLISDTCEFGFSADVGLFQRWGMALPHVGLFWCLLNREILGMVGRILAGDQSRGLKPRRIMIFQFGFYDSFCEPG